MASKPNSYQATAHLFGVSIAAVAQWVKRGLPLNDPHALASAVAETTRDKRLLARCKEIISGNTERPRPLKIESAAEMRQVEEALEVQAINVIRDTERDYKELRHRARLAKEAGNMELYWVLIKESHQVGKLIPEMRLKMSRVGESSGMKITREEFDRLISAIVNRLLVALSRFVDAACAAREVARDADEFRRMLIEAAGGAVFFEAFRQVTRGQSGVGLPEWVAKIIDKEIEGYVEQKQHLQN